MTIVLAAKYSDGVMYCYDTAGRDRDTKLYYPANKVISVPGTPLIMGMSGIICDAELISGVMTNTNFMINDLKELYSSGRSPKKTIRKAVHKYWPGSRYFFNACNASEKSGNGVKDVAHFANRYIFSWNDEKSFNLYEISPIFRDISKKDYSAIGSGAYAVVENFLNHTYECNMAENSVIEMLSQALKIACLKNSELYKKNNNIQILSGKALAKHTTDGLEQLLFEAPTIISQNL